MEFARNELPEHHDADTNAKELARRADADMRLQIQQRIRATQLKLVEACERNVDEITSRQEARALSVADERRQYANALHASKVCARPRCRRTQSCQGDPADCLRVVLPAIGLDKALAHLIERQKRPKRRRR